MEKEEVCKGNLEQWFSKCGPGTPPGVGPSGAE